MNPILDADPILSARASPAEHILVCPPEVPLLQRLSARARGWLADGLGDSAPADHPRDHGRVHAARQDFTEALHDVEGPVAARLVHRIHAAPSLRELWHLRVDVFALLSAQWGQQVADERLARLNRHFPTRSPRSGFGSLDGPAR